MPLSPGPAHCAPLTFGQALDLALDHNGGGSTATPPPGKPAEGLFCPVPLQNSAALAAQLDSANEMGLSRGGTDFTSFPLAGLTTPLALRSKRDIILCTALLYTQLEDLQFRRRLVRKQEALARRLMDIESRRVSAEVDHPVELTHAKMLRARTRMESAALDASRQAVEGAAAFLGEPVEAASVVEGSMPSLPENPAPAGEDSSVLPRLLAFRDLVQLDYVAAWMNRQKAMHDMALARASVGAFVAAQLEETMKFAALVRFNNQARLAKIQLLGTSGDLESWAFGQRRSQAGASGAIRENPTPDAVSDDSNQIPARHSQGLISLLIAPAIPELPAGKTQQYSAIATDSDGRARDVTGEATWSCSRDTDAVLSTTGLLTALSEAQLTIRVEFQGLTSDRKLSILTPPSDEDAAL